jgi:hypothetical protein
VTDERRPRRSPPPDQRPDPNEEFRRALERETDLSLREDPERRRTYTSMDLPRSRSPSDDRSLPTRRHHRYDELTWNGETLTLVGWSQRTGIHVEVLLRRCRRGLVGRAGADDAARGRPARTPLTIAGLLSMAAWPRSYVPDEFDLLARWPGSTDR